VAGGSSPGKDETHGQAGNGQVFGQDRVRQGKQGVDGVAGRAAVAVDEVEGELGSSSDGCAVFMAARQNP